jgi:hypothetical protein
VRESNDIVCVSTGTLTEIQARHDALSAVGIESRVVGDHLTAGLGTALPGTLELWVHRNDLRAATAVLAGAPAGHREPHGYPVPHHRHPVSDPAPDRSRGPQHGAPPHRPLPS